MGLKPQELILSLFWKPKYKAMVSVGIALCSEEIYFMPFFLLWGVSKNPGFFWLANMLMLASLFIILSLLVLLTFCISYKLMLLVWDSNWLIKKTYHIETWQLYLQRQFIERSHSWILDMYFFSENIDSTYMCSPEPSKVHPYPQIKSSLKEVNIEI